MRQACKCMSCGFAVLLSLWVVSCSGGPASPTDFQAQGPTLSPPSSALDAGGEARGCTSARGTGRGIHTPGLTASIPMQPSIPAGSPG